MPFFSRKGKGRAEPQDMDDEQPPRNPARGLQISSPVLDESSNKHVAAFGRLLDSSPAFTAADVPARRLADFWEKEMTGRSITADRTNACTLKNLAATKAEMEAMIMYFELNPSNRGLTHQIMSDQERDRLCKAHKEVTGFPEVPPRMIARALERTLQLHGECCCKALVEDPQFPWFIRANRSFRGPNPLPITPQATDGTSVSSKSEDLKQVKQEPNKPAGEFNEKEYYKWLETLEEIVTNERNSDGNDDHNEAPALLQGSDVVRQHLNSIWYFDQSRFIQIQQAWQVIRYIYLQTRVCVFVAAGLADHRHKSPGVLDGCEAQCTAR